MVDIQPKKTTMTSDHCTGRVPVKAVSVVQEQQPNVGNTRTLLLRGSAAPHKARASVQDLEREQLHVLTHPPYSPASAICD